MKGNSELQAFLWRALASNTADAADDDAQARTLHREGAGDRVLEFFTSGQRAAASRMGRVYELLYCFENSVRGLIETTLRDTLGPERWWSEGIPSRIRNKADKRRVNDERSRWHGPRGASPLNFVDFPELAEVIVERWPDFEDLLGDQQWVQHYFDDMNKSRRAIGHTGEMSQHAVERMELFIREWFLVVG